MTELDPARTIALDLATRIKPGGDEAVLATARKFHAYLTGQDEPETVLGTAYPPEPDEIPDARERGLTERAANESALARARAEVRRLSALVGEYPPDWVDRWKPADEYEMIGDQIDRLADAILRLDIGEPSESAGAVDVAIRLLRWAYGTSGVYLLADPAAELSGIGYDVARAADRRTRSAAPWRADR